MTCSIIPGLRGISLDGMLVVLLTWVSCSVVHPLMGISLDGMSVVLLTWDPCSTRHPLMGISLDGMSVVLLTILACSVIAQFRTDTSHEGRIRVITKLKHERDVRQISYS
jgi:hypothetical protein